jgi:hypothetical protein
MNMKATILLGALLSAGTLLAQTPDTSQASTADSAQSAQPQTAYPPRNADPVKQAAHLQKQLGLSDDQVAQITPILTDRQQKIQNLVSDTGLSRRDRRKQAKAIMKDSKQKLEAVMNDNQKQQYEQMLSDRRSQRGRHQQSM